MPEMARPWMKWFGFLLFARLLLFIRHHWNMARGLLLAAAQASYGANFSLCAGLGTLEIALPAILMRF